MKDCLILRDLHTFPNEYKISLKKVNLFFGKNGCGKSSICRFVKEKPDLLVENQEELIVFNKEFKESRIIDGMQGIYTFGKEDSETLKEISSINQLKKEKQDEKEGSQTNMGKTKEQQDKCYNDFYEEMWKVKNDIKDQYPNVTLFQGYNDSKKKFGNKILSDFRDLSKKEFSASEVDELYSSYKDNNSEPLPSLLLLDDIDLSSITGFELLSKPIVSQSDNDLNKFYTKLNNLNWIRQGKGYISGNICPFCKSQLNDRFLKDFKAIFDEIYEDDIKTLSTFINHYTAYTNGIIEKIEINGKQQCGNIDTSSIRICESELRLKINEEIKQLNRKKEDPSLSIVFNGISKSIESYNQQVGIVNERITNHNNLIAERKRIPSLITNSLWIKISKDHQKKCENVLKCINGLNNQIAQHQKSITDCDEKINSCEGRLKVLYQKISNIEETVTQINTVLSNFGFNSFKLHTDDEMPGTYRIVRPVGTGGMDTLSEGEYNLVAFLYLYRLIYGSLNPDDGNKGAIVVIDDPASSMDGDTMNIISTLTRKIMLDCINDKSRVKQLLVFTHNAFFYKEIEYRSSKKDVDVSYHHIIKNKSQSTIKTTKKSRIHSNYEQLWFEYKSSNSPVSNLNCMRRIMEYYFRLLIGVESYDDVRSKIDECDQIMFDGLTNMLNSGSHSVFDPIDSNLDEDTIERYKEMFKKIFELTGNIGHYNSMMNLSFD